MRDGKKRDESGRNFPYAGMCAERLVQGPAERLVQSESSAAPAKNCMTSFVCAEIGVAVQQSMTNAAANRVAVLMLQLSQARHSNCCEEGLDVLETIAIILIVLWLLGMVSGYTLGNFIWVLLVIAVVLFLVRLVSGRRVV
jgi:hypothetical protein